MSYGYFNQFKARYLVDNNILPKCSVTIQNMNIWFSVTILEKLCTIFIRAGI